MICECKTRFFTASIFLANFLVSGCAATTTSLKFTQSELKLVPVVEFQKVLSSGAMNETVEVNARSIDGTAVVKGFEGQKYIIVTDKYGQEIRLSISEITQIERIRRIKRPDTTAKKSKSNNGEAVGETLIYAPIVPVAIAMWPALRASGLDAGKNAEDKRKARLVYEGMSKEDLKTYVGEPKEKYYCKAKGKAYEAWVFEKDKVLRGGRALFIDLESDKVYHNSYHTSFFKDDCSLIKQ
jgi:hypothetical protein